MNWNLMPGTAKSISVSNKEVWVNNPFNYLFYSPLPFKNWIRSDITDIQSVATSDTETVCINRPGTDIMIFPVPYNKQNIKHISVPNQKLKNLSIGKNKIWGTTFNNKVYYCNRPCGEGTNDWKIHPTTIPQSVVMADNNIWGISDIGKSYMCR